MCIRTRQSKRVLLFTVAFLATGYATSSGAQESGAGNATKSHEGISFPSLSILRQAVRNNEALLNPIKLSYKIEYHQEGSRPATSGRVPVRPAGRRYSHAKCIWAHSGHKHYASKDTFYGPDELARKMLFVIDEEKQEYVAISLPDRSRNSFNWNTDIPITTLGLRPFEGNRILSDILTPAYAKIQDQKESVGGRETWVVDASRPEEPVYHARMWIDPERGIPLRIRYFDNAPQTENRRLTSTIDQIQLHQLSNGGVLPIAGTRTLHFVDRSSRITVNVDLESITTEPGDIPDFLFEGSLLQEPTSPPTATENEDK